MQGHAYPVVIASRRSVRLFLLAVADVFIDA